MPNNMQTILEKHPHDAKQGDEMALRVFSYLLVEEVLHTALWEVLGFVSL